MRFRHAAALALVGWYLMLPPPNPDNKNTILLGADLSLWAVYESYDNAKECRRERETLKARIPFTDTDEVLKRGSISDKMRWFGQCVATDDPRLKQK